MFISLSKIRKFSTITLIKLSVLFLSGISMCISFYYRCPINPHPPPRFFHACSCDWVISNDLFSSLLIFLVCWLVRTVEVLYCFFGLVIFFSSWTYLFWFLFVFLNSIFNALFCLFLLFPWNLLRFFWILCLVIDKSSISIGLLELY